MPSERSDAAPLEGETPEVDALYDSDECHSLAAWFKLASKLERKLQRSLNGECLKCGIGPRRETCAHPEACEHPGRVLALELNQALLQSATPPVARKTGPLGMKVCNPACHSAAVCLNPDNCTADMSHVRSDRDAKA